MRSTAGIEVANPILNVETARSIFIPALSEQASESLSTLIMINDTQWSNAVAITTKDWPEGRKKGSAFCTQIILPSTFDLNLSMTGGGWAGTQGFIDPVTGIATVFGVQVIPRPAFDAESYGLWHRLEKLTYAGLLTHPIAFMD